MKKPKQTVDVSVGSRNKYAVGVGGALHGTRWRVSKVYSLLRKAVF